MAKKRGGGGAGEGGSWMDTYGDLVTLLLCFFVLLYSMSSVDQNKWEVFVRSIYPNSVDQAETSTANEININGEIDANATASDENGIVGDPESLMNNASEMDTNKLYLTLSAALQQAQEQAEAEDEELDVSDTTISRGKDYTFIIFKDKTFFEGDSSVLTEQGKAILDVFCKTIKPISGEISQINIMGHTAQADPSRPNTIRGDRMISTNRAAEVTIYIQQKNIVEPSKLVDIGYGQYRPIASNDTEEGRMANRRVEILIMDKDSQSSVDTVYEDYKNGVNADTTIVTGGGQSTDIHKEAVSTTVDEGAANAPAETDVPTE